MNNVMNLVKVFRNPQAFLQQAMNNGNPIMQNAIQMYQKGDKQGLNELAHNLCKENGKNYDEMTRQIKSQFGI